MKKILTLLICLFFLPAAAQQTEPALTKTQMYADFDAFRESLRTYWSHAEIQRLVTGYDAYREIDSLRTRIDTVTGNAGFYDVIVRMMFACNDPHVSLNFNPNFKEANEASKRWIDRYYRYGYNQKFPVKYIDGRYYSREVVDKDARTIVPEGARIVAVSGIPIDRYAVEANRRMQSNNLWDWKHKKFYAVDLNDPRSIGAAAENTWTYVYKGKKHTVDMEGARLKRKGGMNNIGLFGPVYFEPEGILFIRVPEMNISKLDELKKDILRHKQADIRHIIIDVRGNGGGSDNVWMEMLGALIDRDITVDLSIAYQDKSLAAFMHQYYKQATPIEPTTVGTDTLYNFHYQFTVKRGPESLGYSGPIYVLFDGERCYSSTGSLKSFCNRSDRLVSVGQRSGFLLGVGPTPLVGYLDESLILYRIGKTVETTGVRNGHPEDFYQSRVEVPVKLPPYDKYYRILYNYQGDVYGREFLFKYDPYFRKVLKIAKL